MSVVVSHYPAAIDDGRQFVMHGRVLTFPFADGRTPDAETGDATVGVDVQTQVVEGLIVLNPKQVRGIRIELGFRYQFHPFGAVVRGSNREGALNFCPGWVISGEKPRVQIETGNYALCA